MTWRPEIACVSFEAGRYGFALAGYRLELHRRGRRSWTWRVWYVVGPRPLEDGVRPTWKGALHAGLEALTRLHARRA